MTKPAAKSPVKYPVAKDLKERKYDTIIIGSGMGGMTTAAALALKGRKVLVLEQHYVPGGFTHTFSRKHFTWDVGVHCIGNCAPKNQVRRMFDYISENRLEWEPFGDTYETFHFPGDKKYTFPGNAREFKKQLHDYFPNEIPAIDEYLKLCKKAQRELAPYYAFKTFPRVVGEIAGLIGIGGKKWLTQTTEDVLNQIGMSNDLKQVLTAQWGYYGSAPKDSCFGIHAMVVQHFVHGAFFPVGGAAAIAETVIPTFTSRGGAIALRSPVSKILMRNGRAVGVEVQGGGNPEPIQFEAKEIISAVNALTLVNKLLPEEERKAEWVKSIQALHQSPPHICLYLGFDTDIRKLGATKSNQWFFETKDLNGGMWHCDDLSSKPEVLFVSFPSLKDPKHTDHSSAQTAEVVTFVPWSTFETWKDSRRGNRTPEYRDFKKTVEDRMLEGFKKHFPEMAKHIVHAETSTPLSTEFFDGSPEGAIYGLEHTPRRFLNNNLRPQTPVPGLYLSASDICSGGVSGALSGGMLCAATLEKSILKVMA